MSTFPQGAYRFSNGGQQRELRLEILLRNDGRGAELDDYRLQARSDLKSLASNCRFRLRDRAHCRGLRKDQHRRSEHGEPLSLQRPDVDCALFDANKLHTTIRSTQQARQQAASDH